MKNNSVRLAKEIEIADLRYGPFTSSHEGLGVLTEEYLELVDAIRANDAGAIMKEAIQVAAVALRLARAMEISATRLRSGVESETKF